MSLAVQSNKTLYFKLSQFKGGRSSTTNIKHLYVGECFDKETNFYHMRARDYAPAVGTFTSMDEFEGTHKVPLTLNKYLYSNADPVNKIDPSGFMTLGGLMSGINNLGTIASYAFRIYNILEKVEMSLALSSVWTIAKELRNNIHGIEQLLKDPSLGPGPLPKVDREFLNHISNFDRGVNTLLRNSSALLIQTLMNASVLRELPSAKALVVGGPTPYTSGKLYDIWRKSPAINRVLTLGRVSFKKKRLPIVFSLKASSGTAGRFIGVGTTTDTKTYGFAPQWFRMDWHTPHGAASYTWADPPFHFHVN